MSRRRNISNKRIRNEKLVIRLIVDGETEEDYFNHLNNLEVYERIAFKPKRGNELDYKREKIRESDNPVFFIVDIDAKEQDKALDKLIKNDKIFFNNYSFETFLIAHKTIPFGKVLTKKEYNQKINEHFHVEEYKKTKEQRKKIISQIDKGNLESALSNIKYINNDNMYKNPSSNMHELFAIIERYNHSGG
jgi:RloB-like protein